MLCAGVSGHAVNCHWTFDGCLRSGDYPGSALPRIIFAKYVKIKPAPCRPDTSKLAATVVRRFSSGGFGVVYLASTPEGQQVAIREYFPHLSRPALPASF